MKSNLLIDVNRLFDRFTRDMADGSFMAGKMRELSDEMATKVDIQFYSDVHDALIKAIQE